MCLVLTVPGKVAEKKHQRHCVAKLLRVMVSMFKQASTADMAYAIFGKEHAPQLAERFAREKGFHEIKLASPDDIKGAIAAERIKFALVIPAGLGEQLGAQQQATIQLHYNSAATVDLTRKRVMSVVGGQTYTLSFALAGNQRGAGAITPLTGYIRIRAESLEAARHYLSGNPTFEAGGTVEIRELPRS